MDGVYQDSFSIEEKARGDVCGVLKGWNKGFDGERLM